MKKKFYLFIISLFCLALISSGVNAIEFKIRGLMGNTENVQENQVYSEGESLSFFIDYVGVSHDTYKVRGYKNNINDFDSKIVSNQILISIGNPINITLGKSFQAKGIVFSKVDFNENNSSQTQFYSESINHFKDKGLFFNTLSISFRGEYFEIVFSKNIFSFEFNNFNCDFGNCGNFNENDYKKGLSVEMNMFGIGVLF